MSGELGTLRLRSGDNYVIARSDANGLYDFVVSDHVGGPVPDEARVESLQVMLKEVNELRRQLWVTLNQGRRLPLKD